VSPDAGFDQGGVLFAHMLWDKIFPGLVSVGDLVPEHGSGDGFSAEIHPYGF